MNTMSKSKRNSEPDQAKVDNKEFEIEPLSDAVLDGVAGGTSDSPLCAPPDTL
jgi:hypothetical protein